MAKKPATRVDQEQPDPIVPPTEAVAENAASAENAAPAQEKTTKSIVPSKYAGRYKNGGDDPLAVFIKDQCAGTDGFSFDKFFELCSVNGIAQDKVDHYKNQVAEKRHGAEGRARMTLRNMLATFARKNGKLVALDGNEVPLNMPKVALTGAAKAAAESSQSAEAA